MGGHVELVRGTGFKSMMVACGEAAGTVKETADFHDVAPAALIVTEAGGRITAMDGSRLSLDRQITAGVIISNDLAHEQLVEVACRGHAQG